MKVAFIGLGVMGYPMAAYLAKNNYEVTVYNRTASKAAAWCSENKGQSASTPAAAARDAEIVFSCVGNDNDVHDVLLGSDGVLSSIAEGSVIVDHTTASATIAREVAGTAESKGVDFLDAPLSGGQAGAENGQLSVMVGGDAATFERAAPVMDSYSKAITLIGPVGSGQLAKMVNQICIAGVVQGLAEGLHFAKKAGLDRAMVAEAISGGAAGSWQMSNRWQTMINDEFDFGFAVDWMRKDLAIAIDEATRNGATLELTKLVDIFFGEVQDLGGQRWDTSALIARLK
ncbi:MAG: NAD(P)-dependent oxidoreductase [Gammaproteobacteria bacterium]|nr:NAD(P)-dependent oxidoreductase [Gammaproteobacteria bacterium]